MPRSIRSIPVVAAFLAAFVSAALAAALSLTVLKAEAISDMATGQPVVSITFDAASTEAFAAFTRDNVGQDDRGAHRRRGDHETDHPRADPQGHRADQRQHDDGGREGPGGAPHLGRCRIEVELVAE